MSEPGSVDEGMEPPASRSEHEVPSTTENTRDRSQTPPRHMSEPGTVDEEVERPASGSEHQDPNTAENSRGRSRTPPRDRGRSSNGTGGEENENEGTKMNARIVLPLPLNQTLRSDNCPHRDHHLRFPSTPDLPPPEATTTM